MAPGRDVSLDMLRGLAIVVLVVNHIHLDSQLERVTGTLVSAAEILVAVSGLVAGMVFGRRWRTEGARAASRALLRRAGKLYVASLVVVAAVGVLTNVPGLATEALTVSPRHPDVDLYGFDGPLRMAWAVITLEAGPWQFNILGLFIAVLALAPLVFWALDRGLWGPVLATSVALFAIGRIWQLDVLPSQSERPFPILVWQAPFVCFLVAGWHRERLATFMRARARAVVTAVLLLAGAATFLQLERQGLDPLGLNPKLGLDGVDWATFDLNHFDKTTLDPLRIATLTVLASALYLLASRFSEPIERVAGWLLLPLGRNSFYVFIVHVFICLAVASIPALAGAGLGPAGNAVVQLACLTLLWLMVRQRFLFRWIPR
jgi:hypothetical protein